MSAARTQWGTTPPVSVNFPTDSELAANDALVAELKKQNNFESVEETERRYLLINIQTRELLTFVYRKTTLQLIQKVVVEFVKHVSKSKNLPQSTVASAGGKIFTYGSYRLGVYGPGVSQVLPILPRAEIDGPRF